MYRQALLEELLHIGLFDPEDDPRLRLRDCEDNVICQHFRAAQDNLRAVRKRAGAERDKLAQALQQTMPGLEQKAQLDESNKRLEQQ